jgi:hypothetical protein
VKKDEGANEATASDNKKEELDQLKEEKPVDHETVSEGEHSEVGESKPEKVVSENKKRPDDRNDEKPKQMSLDL